MQDILTTRQGYAKDQPKVIQSFESNRNARFVQL